MERSLFFYPDIFDAVLQNDVDQLVSRVIVFVGDFIDSGQGILPYPDGNDAGAVLAASFDHKGFIVVHSAPPSERNQGDCSLNTVQFSVFLESIIIIV